jgi:hypothetical protein
MILTSSSSLFQIPQKKFCSEVKPKNETMFDKIKEKLKGVQHALYSNHIVSTTSLSEGDIKVGDEPIQLRRLANSTEAHFRQVQEEKEQATKALNKAK